VVAFKTLIFDKLAPNLVHFLVNLTNSEPNPTLHYKGTAQ